MNAEEKNENEEYVEIDVSPQQEPQPQPEQQKAEPKEKTRLIQFKEALEKYPDIDTAKDHLSEIAKRIGCAKSLGYKALKQISKFTGETVRSVEPTMRPIDGTSEPIQQEVEPEVVAQTEYEEVTSPETTAPAPPVVSGFQSKDVEWMFSKGFKGLADLTGYEGWTISKEDSQRLGEIWTPIINQNLTAILPYTPFIVAGVTTVMIVAPRVKGYMDYRGKKKKEKAKTTPQEPQTKPDLSKEQQRVPSETQVESPLESKPKPETAGFLAKIQ